MKSFLLFMIFSFSINASAESTLDRCRNAALATGYVHENMLSVSVDGSRLDKEDQEIFWTMLTDDVFSLLKHYPATYQLGNYFPNSYLKFTFKLRRDRNSAEDMKLENGQRSLIHYMQIIEGVKVDCAYVL